MNATLVVLICLSFLFVLFVLGEKEDFVSDRECPFLCTCHEYDVNCSNTNIFPEGIPKMTERFFLSDSVIDYVPINAFLDLPFLQEIHFLGCNIVKLRACSFAELENMTKISFQNSSIDQIEGNAFSNLYNISIIQFAGSAIGDMFSYSFHNVNNVESVDFYNTKISTIHPLAMKTFAHIGEIGLVDCTVDRFLVNGFSSLTNITLMYMSNSVVNEWQCGSIASVLASGTDFDITKSSFVCDCKLAWLWTKHRTIFNNDRLKNKCKKTDDVLSKVDIDQLCPTEKSREPGCPPLIPSTPHICSRSFDSPMNPIEKVTYPASFTRTSTSSAVSVVKINLKIILTIFFTKYFQWLLH
jgi:hypothetical protein